MAPNLLIKAAFVRGELADVENRHSCSKDAVRTEFILQNTFAYLLGDRYSFDSVSAINKKENAVLKSLKYTIDSFRQNYASTVKSLCTEIDEISEDTIGSVLLGVSNELFCEGITWSRIVAYFVFVGEFTILCLSRSLSKSVVEVMYDNFSRLVKEKLEPWIFDHNGWEGISSLSVGTQQDSSSMTLNSGWGKSLLHGTVRMIGTLAQIANSTSVYP